MARKRGESIDLSGMSRKELEQLRAEIDRRLKKLEAQERQEALRAAERAAREFGYSLSDLVNGTVRKGGSKLAPRYRNPDNPEQTWTGRGRRPAWFVKAIESGVTPEQMEIGGK